MFSWPVLTQHTSSSASTWVPLAQNRMVVFSHRHVLLTCWTNRTPSCHPPHIPEVLSNDPNDPPTEYFLVGDDTFPLRSYLSRGLTKPECIYNYRLNRGRRTVENAFGSLANRFQVFHTSLCLTTDHAKAVVLASCVLLNMLRGRNPPRQEGDHEDPAGRL